MRFGFQLGLGLGLMLFGGTGCGSFMARRMAQAPNTYPQWLAPRAPVTLNFSPKMLTNFPARFLEVGPPAARLRYRVVEPAAFDLRISSTNWTEGGREQFKYSIQASVPGRRNAWTAAPRGTVVLLHGYALAQFAMAPWALRLAEEGWRCVLVDLRGHGKSTGRRIYYGLRETRDLSQLLDALRREGDLGGKVAVIGDSYGAALALRWKGLDPRVGAVVAIAPYAELARSAMNLRADYAPWLPGGLVRAGLRKLPGLLETRPEELDTTTALSERPVAALFVAGGKDDIAPVADVRRLESVAGPGSQLVVVPRATHESLPYFFHDLVPPVIAWLGRE